MSERVLEWICRGACTLAAPGAVEAYDDAHEMQAAADTIETCADPDNTMEAVEAAGEQIDRVLNPLRRVKGLLRSLVRHR